MRGEKTYWTEYINYDGPSITLHGREAAMRDEATRDDRKQDDSVQDDTVQDDTGLDNTVHDDTVHDDPMRDDTMHDDKRATAKRHAKRDRASSRTRTGRPRLSSREMLEEAASELFIEQTYEATTIDQIARRAGVSRGSFFNYFNVKSDLLWVSVDSAVDRLPELLRGQAAQSATQAVRDALVAAAQGFAASEVPLALTQLEVMAAAAELQQSAMSRFVALVSSVETETARRTGREPGDLICRAFAGAVVSAAAVAMLSWAQEGPGRGSLPGYLAAAVDPVCVGYGSLLSSG